jgi:hypothetical protein
MPMPSRPTTLLKRMDFPKARTLSMAKKAASRKDVRVRKVSFFKEEGPEGREVYEVSERPEVWEGVR